MYKKNVFLFIFIMCLWPASHSKAHSANVATYIIEQNAQANWKLTISVPLGGLHQALLRHYSESDLWIEKGQYNIKLVNEYLVSNSNIAINGETLILKSMQTNLDDHQSDFIFSIENMPSQQVNVDLTLSAMSENSGHINIARIKTPHGNKKIILQANNEYQGKLALI